MANTYTRLSVAHPLGGADRFVQVDKWTFDVDGDGTAVSFNGGDINFGPSEASTYGSGTIVLKKSPDAGVTYQEIGDSETSGAGATADGDKTARLGPCLLKPVLSGSTTPSIVFFAQPARRTDQGEP